MEIGIVKYDKLWTPTPNLATQSSQERRFWSRVIVTRNGKSNIHFNSSEQSVSTSCKLTESSNHLCMHHATMKYLTDLLQQTLDVARRASHAQSRSDVLAEGNLMFAHEENETSKNNRTQEHTFFGDKLDWIFFVLCSHWC